MPGTTPLYGLPYPIAGDSLASAVQATPQALAAQVESTVAALTGAPAPTAWTTLPSLGSGWTIGPNGARYRKVAGIVYVFAHLLKASSAAGETVSTLPAGFRPTQVLPFSGWSGQALTVRTTGAIICETAQSTGGIYFHVAFPL